MPLISVVIPVYNGENTIQETIESVLNQSLPDFELIVINDGSRDLTFDIVSSIKDLRLKVFSYPNAGLSASRNRGIIQSSADYISFIDADDLWTPNKLQDQFNALQANPQAAVAYSWTDFITEAGKFSRRGCYLTLNGDVYANLLLVNFLENGSNGLFRRQALIEVGNFDESLKAAEDWEMYLRLASRYHFVAIPAPQILYRISSNSMSSKVDKQEKETLKVIERAFNQAPKSLQPLKKITIANLYKYLTFKVLEGSPSRERGIKAANILWCSVRSDPSLLQTRIFWKILLAITIMSLLPPTQSKNLLTPGKRLSNTIPLLLTIKLELI